MTGTEGDSKDVRRAVTVLSIRCQPHMPTPIPAMKAKTAARQSSLRSEWRGAGFRERPAPVCMVLTWRLRGGEGFFDFFGGMVGASVYTRFAEDNRDKIAGAHL
jgi:hypothetical protein